MKKSIYLILIIAVLVSIFYFLNDDNSKDGENFISVASVMSEDESARYSKALEPREFIFPDDHAAHNDFKLEWWYFTGNLKGSDNREFSYQFTIFRNALSSDSVDVVSDLATNQLYFAHFGLTDISNEKHYYFEKFARGSDGISGAEAEPLKVFIENWKLSGIYPNSDYKMPVFNIFAEENNISLNLELTPEKQLVLHGNQGLSPKSNEPGNASYYYSYTKLKTIGDIKINNKNHSVSGYSWMDREWSTSALSKNQVGWDWFSIQLDDNTEIMYFRLRNSNDETDFAKGTLIHSNGEYTALQAEDFILKNTQKSILSSGTEYPNKWNLDIPKYDISLNIETRIKEQEMKLSVKYYEGSIKVSGRNGAKDVSGFGFVELTGY